MKIYLLDAGLTNCKNASVKIFIDLCRSELKKYVASYVCDISTDEDCIAQRNSVSQESVLCFFVGDGEYSKAVRSFMQSALDNKAEIWPIALDKDYRMPCKPVSDKQSFDIPTYIEKRQWSPNNMQAVAQIYARKIIGKVLSNRYSDNAKYFISHRRFDGEDLARQIAEKLRVMTLDSHTVYRDVAWVETGDEARSDIDKNLKSSDVLIFLHTAECANSKEVFRELDFAMVHEIPILWICVDNADPKKLTLRPSEQPHLAYSSSEVLDEKRIASICDEIDAKCFELIMNSSKDVISYISSLTDMDGHDDVFVNSFKNDPYHYIVRYKAYTSDTYDDGIQKHYVQYFGRKLKESDVKKEQEIEEYGVDRCIFLDKGSMREKLPASGTECWADNYADYMDNIKENIRRTHEDRTRGEIIVISGAFPDCDEIYKPSLTQAIMVYAKEILRNGYILSFGAHPTFQRALFVIGEKYGFGNEKCIHMHMAKQYLKTYSEEDMAFIHNHCELKTSNNLQEMREAMIGEKCVVAMICLGGKIKADKREQGVDIEVELARQYGVPVFLIGTVGGRSDQMGSEYEKTGNWSALNTLGKEFNEDLIHKINHQEMAQRLIRKIGEKKV